MTVDTEGRTELVKHNAMVPPTTVRLLVGVRPAVGRCAPLPPARPGPVAAAPPAATMVLLRHCSTGTARCTGWPGQGLTLGSAALDDRTLRHSEPHPDHLHHRDGESSETRMKSDVKTKARKTNNQASFRGSPFKNNMEVEAAMTLAWRLDEAGLQ
jgi:hypothetical protein